MANSNAQFYHPEHLVDSIRTEAAIDVDFANQHIPLADLGTKSRRFSRSSRECCTAVKFRLLSSRTLDFDVCMPIRTRIKENNEWEYHGVWAVQLIFFHGSVVAITSLDVSWER